MLINIQENKIQQLNCFKKLQISGNGINHTETKNEKLRNTQTL